MNPHLTITHKWDDQNSTHEQSLNTTY